MHFCLVVRWNTLNIQDQHTLILWSGVNDSKLLDGLSLSMAVSSTHVHWFGDQPTYSKERCLYHIWCWSDGVSVNGGQLHTGGWRRPLTNWSTRRWPQWHTYCPQMTNLLYIQSCLIGSAFPKLHILLILKATDNNCVAMPLISHPYWYRFCHPHCHTLKIPCFYSSTGW